MEAYLVNQETQTIVKANGKVAFFGLGDFVEKIVNGNCCFICGASPEEKAFNDEHIIPFWVLKRFNLFNREINLPNGNSVAYRSFTVPCCADCNSYLGQHIETPISELLKLTYKELAEVLTNDPNLVTLIQQWVHLIYFKTHLKDTHYRQVLDRRIESGRIADTYDWRPMHHIHCMARAHYSGAIIEPQVYGSLLILPAFGIPYCEDFNYMDSIGGQTVMIQLGEIAIIAVLNDSGAAQSLYQHAIEKITSHLVPFQLRELFSRLIYANTNLKERPLYHSTLTQKGYEIQVTFPKDITLREGEEEIISAGELLYQHIVPIFPDDFPDREESLSLVRQGKISYLLDSNGNFNRHKIPSIE